MSVESNFENSDALSYLKALPNKSVNLVLTDPLTPSHGLRDLLLVKQRVTIPTGFG